MKRLASPPHSPLDLYDACVSEAEGELKAHLAINRNSLDEAAQVFDAHSATKTWCDLPRARHGHREDIVIGTLSKGSLMDLYSSGVVGSTGAPRKIYDDIMVAAKGECPYCGGIGTPRTLDHYLPKSKFPAYSVLPRNLVPACRDCNTDAGAGFPNTPQNQPIHPYLDKDCFFNERWVYGEVHRSDPIVVTFTVTPPEHWADNDKQRATQHFAACGLAGRYSSRVAGDISPLILQRQSSLAQFSPDQFRDHLNIVSSDANLLLNGWKRTLYHALCSSDWFCDANFNDDWLNI